MELINANALILTDRRGDTNTTMVTLVADREGIVTEVDRAAGSQLAEFRTGFRVFIKVTEGRRFHRGWKKAMREVEFFSVETVVSEEGAIMAGVGKSRGLGMTREENVVAVAR
jgi:hypothetical protein